MGKTLPLQEEHVRKWREGEEERSWLRTKDESNNLSLSWHPHHSLPARPPALLLHHSFVCQWPLQKCGSHVAEVRPHGYLLKRRVLLPWGHLDILLWCWETQLYCQPQSPTATAAFPPAPDCGTLQPLLQLIGHPTSRMCCTCHQQLLSTTAANLHCCSLSDHLFLSDTPLWNAITPNSFFNAVWWSLTGHSCAFMGAIHNLTHKKCTVMTLHDQNAIHTASLEF